LVMLMWPTFTPPYLQICIVMLLLFFFCFVFFYSWDSMQWCNARDWFCTLHTQVYIQRLPPSLIFCLCNHFWRACACVFEQRCPNADSLRINLEKKKSVRLYNNWQPLHRRERKTQK
jgi:hypothetical protein